MFGWRGQLLRVNLTNGDIKKETLDPMALSAALGGLGLGALLLYAGEALDDVRQAFVQVVAVGRQGDSLGDGFGAADGGEAEVGAPRVEGHDDAFVRAGFHKRVMGDW